MTRKARSAQPGGPFEVFLVWVRTGEYGDAEVLAVGADEAAAKRWCNENRKLENGDPITWSTQGGEATGTTKVTLDLGRHGQPRETRFYVLEPKRVVT